MLRKERPKITIVLFFLSLVAFYWILESLIDSQILRQGSFFNQVIHPTQNKLWFRLSTIAFLAVFYALIKLLTHKQDLKILKSERLMTLQRDIGVRLGSINNLKEALDFILETLLKIKEIDAGGIYLVEKSNRSLNMIVHKGLSEDFVRTISHFGPENLRTKLVMEGQPIYSSHKEVIPEIFQEVMAEDLKALVVIPIRYNGQVVAALNLASHSHEKIPLDARNTIEPISLHIGGIINRLKMEQDLRQSENKLRTLMENSPDIILTIDREGKILFLNRMTFLITPEDALGKSSFSFIPKKYHQRYREALQTVFEKNQQDSAEHELIDHTLWETRLVPIEKDGKVVSAMAIAKNITKRRRAEVALRESEKRYRTLFESSSDGICVIDAETKQIKFASPSFCKMLNYTKEEMEHLDLRDIHPRRNIRYIISEFDDFAKGKKKSTMLIPCLKKDGSIIYTDINTAKMVIEDRECIVGFFRDVSDRIEFEQALRESEDKFSSIATSISDAIVMMDSEGNICSWNEAAETIFGYKAGEVLGKKFYMTVLAAKYRKAYKEGMEEMNKKGTTFIVGKTLDWIGLRKDGSEFPIEIFISSVRVKEKWSAIGVIKDITERKQFEKQLQHGIFYDKLTNLPNRTLFLERVKNALDQGASGKVSFAVLLIDADRFKVIINSLGPSMGDQLLVYMSRRLKRCLSTTDIVGHLGGDEFMVLLRNIKDVNAAVGVAERIQREIMVPFNIGGHSVFITVSIGIVFGKEKYKNEEDILRDADTAMHRAKSEGRARHAIFDDEMYEHAVKLLQTETDLRRSIKENKFCVFYQPIINLMSGKVIGFEALVRWPHPQRGLILPNEFISIAEENGLIIQLDRWTLREACRQVQIWQNGFPLTDPLFVSVNFSSKQFLEPSLPDAVGRILGETGLNPDNLKIEITESVLLEHTDEVIDILSSLKTKNVQLYLDDFGTGYSSLSYLRRLQIDTLKIDRSFVGHMSANRENYEIVKTIIVLAHQLNIEVIAEGIETLDQLEQLRELKCDYGQGFFFSKAIDSQSAQDLILSDPQW